METSEIVPIGRKAAEPPEPAAPNLLPEIRIIERRPDFFTVMCGDRYENQLTLGEALDCAVRVLYRRNPNQLRSREDHQAWADTLTRFTEEEKKEIVEP